jgi:hypothetical protein
MSLIHAGHGIGYTEASAEEFYRDFREWFGFPIQEADVKQRRKSAASPPGDGGLRAVVRHLVDLHVQEQEGLMLPTPQEWLDAVDAVAEALGPHPGPAPAAPDALREAETKLLDSLVVRHLENHTLTLTCPEDIWQRWQSEAGRAGLRAALDTRKEGKGWSCTKSNS